MSETNDRTPVVEGGAVEAAVSRTSFGEGRRLIGRRFCFEVVDGDVDEARGKTEGESLAFDCCDAAAYDNLFVDDGHM